MFHGSHCGDVVHEGHTSLGMYWPQTIELQCSLLCPGLPRQEGLAKESGHRMWYLGALDSRCQEEAEICSDVVANCEVRSAECFTPVSTRLCGLALSPLAISCPSPSRLSHIQRLSRDRHTGSICWAACSVRSRPWNRQEDMPNTREPCRGWLNLWITAAATVTVHLSVPSIEQLQFGRCPWLQPDITPHNRIAAKDTLT